MLETITPLIGPLLLGKLTTKVGLCSVDDMQGLKTFILKVAVPILIFKNLCTANLEAIAEIRPIVTGFLITSLLFFVCAMLLNKILKWNKLDRRAAVLGLLQGNHAYLAMGILGNLYGEPGLVLVILYIITFWPVFLFAGYTYVAIETGDSLHPLAILKKALKYGGLPMSVSIFGLLTRYFGWQVPDSVIEFTTPFSAMVVPLILVVVGADMRIRQGLKEITKVLPMALSRPILGGLIGFIAVYLVDQLFELKELTAKILFLQATMPTAYMTVFFTEDLETNKSLLATSMTIGTILAFVAVPIWEQVFVRLWAF